MVKDYRPNQRIAYGFNLIFIQDIFKDVGAE
jgi:hypothetical protein